MESITSFIIKSDYSIMSCIVSSGYLLDVVTFLDDIFNQRTHILSNNTHSGLFSCNFSSVFEILKSVDKFIFKICFNLCSNHFNKLWTFYLLPSIFHSLFFKFGVEDFRLKNCLNSLFFNIDQFLIIHFFVEIFS